MKEILKYLDTVVDNRQASKVMHKMGDIIAIVFFAMLANANEWVEIKIFGREHEEFLRKYLELPNGIPSHETIQRVFAMVSEEFWGKFHKLWNEMLSSEEGRKIKKILAIDGKAQRGNGNRERKANHIVSVVDENGFCLGEKRVDEKTNEIKAILELLDDLTIKGHIITIDAMGTQTEIAKKIRKKNADYVLALKRNQCNLYEDVSLYFNDPDTLKNCAYTKTNQQARSGIERREYWQSTEIDWLPQKKDWVGLKSIIMTRNTIIKDGLETTETRYLISSLPQGVQDVARAIRGHWMVESHHWHLDVTFLEDANHTLEKAAAYGLNIIRKIALSVLKIFQIGKHPLSLKKKRFAIGTNPEKYLLSILVL
jgi:predicted transposase YbfD/YdcC